MKRKKFTMQLILLSIALVFTCFIRSDDSSARRSALSKRGKNDICSFSTTRSQCAFKEREINFNAAC